jgi:hypothetical protein
MRTWQQKTELNKEDGQTILRWYATPWQTFSVVHLWAASTHCKLKCSLSFVLHPLTPETPMNGARK